MYKLKHFISALLITMIVVSAATTAIFATGKESGMDNFVKRSTYISGQFSDVTSTDWFSGNVQTVSELGLMNGKGSGRFDPNGNVTIAETITIASRLHAIYHTGNDQFEASTPWYQAYVDYALANQIIAQPAVNYNAAATRVEFAAVLSNALPRKALPEINQVADDSIPDVSMDDDGADTVYLLYRAGIMTGSDALGTFHPDTNIKRSEIAAVISRMVDKTQRKAVTLEKRAKVIASGLTAEPDYMRPQGYASWTFTDDGTLTISGAERMPPYYEYGEARPWEAYKDQIKTVIVADGVQNVSGLAFQSNNAITRVVLADSVTSIGFNAFDCCNNITEFVLPKTMKEIGSTAFAGTDIKEITIPNGITKLEDTFVFCDKLERVILPEGLKTLGLGTFAMCDNLKTIYIPASVTNLSRDFAFGTNLKNVYFYGNVPKSISSTSIPKTATIYFVADTEGWTTPTWTAPDGTVYQTRTFDPELIPYAE